MSNSTLTAPPARPGTRSRSRMDAVWPRPQIDASRIAWPISRRRASSVAADPRGVPPARRASSSSWRTVPTRHGTHCPHDSSRKKAAIRRRMSTRSVERSKTITTPEPEAGARSPACPRTSAACRAHRPPRTTPAAPPRRMVRISRSASGPRTPPARSMSSRRVVPNGDLVDARPLDVAAQAEELRARSSPRCRSPRTPRRRRAG